MYQHIMGCPYHYNPPKLQDGTLIDGPKLLELVRADNPLPLVQDVSLLIQELEETFGADVTEIPRYVHGRFHQVSQ